MPVLASALLDPPFYGKRGFKNFMFLLVTRLLVHIVLDSYIFSLPWGRAIQQTARNCAEQFSVLSPREKCESKRALPSVVDCYFHHRMNLPSSIRLTFAFALELF
jgi:hypothetical protein